MQPQIFNLSYYLINLLLHLLIICKELESNEQDLPLSGVHFVVDGSNGAGGFFATQVLEPLGADISGSIFLEPDGTFPNHVPNPEDEKAMECIRKATLEHQADLGIIFDTDVDRAATVFPNGKEINRNALIALMGAIVAKTNPGSTVVTDSVTSDQLKDFLENRLGLKHHRFKRGYRNVINESVRLNREGIESCLAIETSGHGALSENYFLDENGMPCYITMYSGSNDPGGDRERLRGGRVFDISRENPWDIKTEMVFVGKLD